MALAAPPAAAQTYSCADASADQSRIIAGMDALGCGLGSDAGKPSCRALFRDLVRAERARDRTCSVRAVPRNRGGLLNDLFNDGAGFVLGGF